MKGAETQAYYNTESILRSQNFENIRILKRNLVYLQGLPKFLASADTLKSAQFLGQYGNVTETYIKKENKSQGRNKTFNAHITFEKEVQAALAILCINGLQIDGKTIKASFGMTKFCQYFLQDLECPKRNCNYIHKVVSTQDLTSTTNKNINNNIRKIGEKETIMFILQKGINTNTKSVKFPIFPCVKMGLQKINNFRLSNLNGISNQTSFYQNQQFNFNNIQDKNQVFQCVSPTFQQSSEIYRYKNPNFKIPHMQEITSHQQQSGYRIRKQFRQCDNSIETFQSKKKATKKAFNKKRQSKREGCVVSSTDDESCPQQDQKVQSDQYSIFNSFDGQKKEDVFGNFDFYLRTPTPPFSK